MEHWHPKPNGNEVEEVPLSSLIGWILRTTGTALTAFQGEFYTLLGRRVRSLASVLNISAYDYLAIREEGGVVGLIVDEDDHVLVRAVPEPGYSGIDIEVGGVQRPSQALIAPSVQFSLARLAKFGAQVPFADLFMDFDLVPDGGAENIRPKPGIVREPQPADGWRYVDKVDYYSVLRVKRSSFEALLVGRSDADNYVWADHATLAGVRTMGICNAYLRSALACLA